MNCIQLAYKEAVDRKEREFVAPVPCRA